MNFPAHLRLFFAISSFFITFYIFYYEKNTLQFPFFLPYYYYGTTAPSRVCIRVDTLNSVMMITRSTQITWREKKTRVPFHTKKLNGVVIKVKTLKLVMYAKCGRYVFCINLLKFESVI